MPDLSFTPVDHNPFSEDSPQLERIPPQMNIPAQTQWGAKTAADVLGNVTGISDAARAWRGEMTPEEQRNFALTAAAGVIPGARALKPAVKAVEEVAPGALRGFHGSPLTELTTLDPDAYRLGARGDSSALGVAFATDPRLGKEAAGHYAGPSGRVYQADLTGNFYNMTAKEYGAMNSAADFRQFRDVLTSKGYDGVRLPENVAHSGEVVVWNPDKISLSGVGGGTETSAGRLPTGSPAIKAYHGSPYDFERFDLSKIGTGEGAQAYGHGLYFAEQPETALSYRNALAPRDVRIKDSSGKTFDPLESEDWGVKTAGSFIVESPHGTIDSAIEMLSKRIPTYPEGYPDRGLLETARDQLREWKTSGHVMATSPGRMYEVSIAADPDHFLHWDKPLSEQSEYVKNTVKNALGDQAFNSLQSADARAIYREFHPLDFKAATALRSAGIPGIKYLDQGSRGAGEGTHNYVVFDANLVNIIKKYGLAGLTTMGAAHFSTTPVEGDPFEEKKRAAGGRVNADNIDTDPTEAQKKAGNYAKDHVSIHGLDITIENAKGHERRGVDKGGKPWAVKMPCHYGYFKRTQGKDGDHVDVYLGPHTKSPKVFVIDQKNAETGRFDEHKTFIGFASESGVRRCYAKAFSDGKAHLRLGHIEGMTVEQFKHWLENGDTTKPIKNGEDKKLPHAAVGYLATSPHVGKYCGVCSMFLTAGPHCTLVADPVRAAGFCKRFFKGTPHAA